jgi:hypothetical protein
MKRKPLKNNTKLENEQGQIEAHKKVMWPQTKSDQQSPKEK